MYAADSRTPWSTLDEEESWSPLVALPGHKKLGLGRHWHFLSIQFWILTGVVYVVMIFTTGYWHYLVPTSWSIVPDSIRSIGTYLQFKIPPTIPGQPFESAQKLAYFLVIFVLAPLQIATGAAMSPSVLARFPWYGRLFGGKQGARSLHFLGMCAFVRAGEHHDLVLDLGEGTLDEPVDVTTAWQATEQAWREAVPPLENTVAADTRHSYAVLRGLTTSGGGMVAAATTSLPERADAGRNYDYRYFWIHDQCYTGQAIAAAGAHLLLDDATRFVSARLLQDGPHLTPAYTPSGGPVPDQRQLGLPGYPGGHDLVGNWVNQQFQLDAFGEALLLLAAAARHDHLDDDGRRAVNAAVSAIIDRRNDPDAGVWEIDDRAWTHSRLICAAGLRAVATHVATTREAAEWSALADSILAETSQTSLHPTGRWQRSPNDPGLDGALLLPPIRGALDAHDPRTLSTLQAYRDELTTDYHAYRFRHDERPLHQAEGAFLRCGFVMCLAELQQDHAVEAFRWFERNRSACGPPSLFSEEYDVVQRQLRGNLPQAFVHARMLECAARLDQPATQQ